MNPFLQIIHAIGLAPHQTLRLAGDRTIAIIDKNIFSVITTHNVIKFI